MKKLVLAVLAAMLFIVPAADAKAFRATVVKRNVAKKTNVVATRAGTLKVIHGHAFRVGTVLRINGRSVRVVGHARRVKIKGVVVAHSARTVTLSAGRARVRIRSHAARLLGRKHGHQLGNGLRVTAKISANGTLTEMNEVENDDVDGAELKGMLVCTPTSGAPCDPASSTLMIDIGAAGTPNLIPVVFDATLFPDTMLGPLVGQQVEAEVSLGPSALDANAVTLTLTAIKSEGACQAENEQGDANGGGNDGLKVQGRDHGDGCEADD
jgi:hypothetical protein